MNYSILGNVGILVETVKACQGHSLLLACRKAGEWASSYSKDNPTCTAYGGQACCMACAIFRRTSWKVLKFEVLVNVEFRFELAACHEGRLGSGGTAIAR